MSGKDRIAQSEQTYRWVLVPRVLFDGLGDAIREVVGDSKTREINRESAEHLVRLAAAWSKVEWEAR